MKFASREIKENSQKYGISSLHSLRHQNKKKYKQTLHFMQEWTSDLMERENQLEQQRQEHYMRVLKQAKENVADSENRLNLQKLVKEEFLNKMESLYIKQLVMANITDGSLKEDSLNDLSDSLNRSQQTFTQDHHYFEKESPSSNHFDC